MSRSPRQPKGPPLEDLWLKNQKSALAFLEKSRDEDEIDQLVTAGAVGLRFAEVISLLYPYRKWITGPKGATSPPEPKLNEELVSFPEHRAELSYTELLAHRVNPQGARLADRHAQLKERSPLAQLSAIGAEALEFVETYSSMRLHAERLGRIIAADARIMKKLDTMRQPRQMFCACVLIVAERLEFAEPTAGELAALALQTRHAEFVRELSDSARKTLLREKAWDDLKREVKKGLLGVVMKLVDTPFDDPGQAS